ncbi:hypothetical protein [Halobaculum limi]|uniref:hypothetical protein n=1 Tax=Halobaculum limi TaxID=3031916 RepID=UPI0024063F21|nr:hypothetical protein [Halobaculum sp. YSMS11]
MSALQLDSERRRLVAAAVPGGAVIAVALVAVAWTRLLSTGRAPDELGAIALGVATGTALATVTFVPFVVAVLFVVATPSRRVVAGSAVLVYAVGLVGTGWQYVFRGLSGLRLTILAVPLSNVVPVVAVATAVWIAYGGGFDRLAAITGEATHHPLFAQIADERIGPGLSVQRGLAAAGVGGLVAAGGLVAIGVVANLLTALGTPGATGPSTVVFVRSSVWNVGIPAGRLPRQWLFEASFLLAILFVTGPRLRVREFLKAVGVVVAVQSTVALLPMLIPPFDPVYILDPSGPVLTPLSDVVTVAGVAVAVWLAFHRGSAPSGPGRSASDARCSAPDSE